MFDDRDQILALENQRQAALVEVDMPALDAIFAEDLIHIHSNGLVQTKAELLAHIESRRAFVAIDRGDLAIRFGSDMAVVTGRITNHMRHNGGLIELTGFVTQVVRKDNGAWRFVNFQFTPDPAR